MLRYECKIPVGAADSRPFIDGMRRVARTVSSSCSAQRRGTLSAPPRRPARAFSCASTSCGGEGPENRANRSPLLHAADEWASRADAFLSRVFLLPPPAQLQVCLAGVPDIHAPSYGGGLCDASQRTAEGLSDALSSLWDGILHMAVPKNRKTRSKKRIKNFRKRVIPDKKNIITCKVCGELKLMHHLCKGCLKRHKEEWPRHRMEEEKKRQWK